MKKILFIFLLPIFLLSNEKINTYTENYPPYNFEKDGQIHGISVEILYAMYEKMGEEKKKPLLTNWSRGYTMTQKKKNSVIFSTTKTKSREKLFKWVGPICKTTVEIIAKKDKKIKIKTLKDLNKYKIGTVLKDIGETFLLDNGVSKEQIYSVSGTNAIELSFKKLEKDRIDLFSYEYKVAKYEAKGKNFDVSKYENVFTLIDGELYFAFNLDTDDKIVNKWQKALDEIKANGTYKKIMDKYEE